MPMIAFSVDFVGRAIDVRDRPTSNSSTSLMLIANDWSVTDPSLLAGPDRDVAGRAVLRGRSPPPTVTTPVLASIANRPPSLSGQAYR